MALEYIGIDLGGTKIHSARYSETGVLLKDILINTSKNGKEEVIKQLVDSINNLKNESTKEVGICFPGQVDVEKGAVICLPNLKGWEGVGIREIIERETKLKVCIENDARCFLIAESLYGAAKGAKNAVGVVLGTGVGGALLIDGKIYSGSGRIAGELGHMVIETEGPRCECGNNGCLEQFASGSAISRRFHLLSKRALDANEIFVLASKGDEIAKEVVEEAGRYLGIGVANIINVINPEIVVIGGSVSNSFEQLIPFVRREVEGRVLVPGRKTKIEKKKLDHPGVLGASLLAKNRNRE